MKFKHVPEPWCYVLRGGTVASEPQETGFVVGPRWMFYYRSLGLHPNDARLISCAPEMLEALIDAYKRFIEYEIAQDDNAPLSHRAAMLNYKSIIERATGMTISEILE